MTTILAYGTNQYLYALLIDPVTREMGWSRSAIAAGFSGVVLVSGFAGLLAGPAVDRYGARVLLSAGSLVNGLSLLALSRTTSLPAFDLLWTLGIGLGSALTFYPVTMTVLANWFERERPRALGLLTLMGAFSSTITYPLAGVLIARFGWRDALIAFAAMHLAIALPLHAVVVRRRPEDFGLAPDGAAVTSERAAEIQGVGLREALHGPAFWCLALAFSLAYFASTAILLEHVAYLIARGYAPATAASLVGLIGLAYIPGRLVVASAGTRIPLALALAGAFLLEALGIATLALRPSLGGVLVYVLAFGAAYGAMSPLRGAIVAHFFGRKAYGAIMGAQGIPVALASAAAPVVTAQLISAQGFVTAFATCACALVAAAIAIVPLVRRRPRA